MANEDKMDKEVTIKQLLIVFLPILVTVFIWGVNVTVTQGKNAVEIQMLKTSREEQKDINKDLVKTLGALNNTLTKIETKLEMQEQEK